MKISITQRLVAGFVGLTLIVLAATLVLARWSFQQGFLDYINALEQTRLERVQAALGQEYLSADGSWSGISPQRFGNLLREANATDGTRRPVRRRPETLRRTRGVPPGPPPGATVRGMPPTSLYDAQGELVAGMGVPIDAPDVIRVAVVLDGRTIGELRSEPRRQLSTPMETAFSRRQLETSWIIGAASLTLAVVLSVWLANGLLGPVRRMLNVVKNLSRGNYDQNLLEQRSDELGELTRDLNRLAKILADNKASRQRLLADISHELRTPLTVLTGELEALKDGIRPFNAQQLQSLDQEVSRLRFLVDDLYEFALSDIGGLRYEFKVIDLSECVSAAVTALRSRADEQQLTLIEELEKPAQIEGDQHRIDQLLRNLLENSLAYTDAPGEIRLNLRSSDEQIILTLDDSSPGARPDECASLFDPLHRLDESRSRRRGGAGLGLAISKNIVEAHRGTIEARPSDLGGLQILVAFPASMSTAEESMP